MKLEAKLANGFNQQAELFIGPAPADANAFTVMVSATDTAGAMVTGVVMTFDEASSILSADAVNGLSLKTIGWAMALSGAAAQTFTPSQPFALASGFPLTLGSKPDGMVGASDQRIRVDVVLDEQGVNSPHAYAPLVSVPWQQPGWLPDRVDFILNGSLLLTQDADYPVPAQTLTFLLENKGELALPLPAPGQPGARLELFFNYGPDKQDVGPAEVASGIRIGPSKDAPSGQSVWQAGNDRKPENGMEAAPHWVLQPPSTAQQLLGAGHDGIVSFDISAPAAWPDTQPGETQLHIKWFNVPGYDDGATALPLHKAYPVPAVTFSGPSPLVVDEGQPCLLSWTSVGVHKLVLSTTGLPSVTFDAPADMNRTAYPAPLPPPPEPTATFTLTATDLTGQLVKDGPPPVTITVQRPAAVVRSFTYSPPCIPMPPTSMPVEVSWTVDNALRVTVNGDEQGTSSRLTRTLTGTTQFELQAYGHDGKVVPAIITVPDFQDYLIGKRFGRGAIAMKFFDHTAGQVGFYVRSPTARMEWKIYDSSWSVDNFNGVIVTIFGTEPMLWLKVEGGNLQVLKCRPLNQMCDDPKLGDVFTP